MSFWGDVGTVVQFKKNNPRTPLEWTVADVETDWSACKWTKGGTRPLFIKLERPVVLAGGRKRIETVYTYTEALKQPDRKRK